ncbi:MAG: patatin-like phospholipase family protein [Prevotella sp.]|jgi:NTE family protein
MKKSIFEFVFSLLFFSSSTSLYAGDGITLTTDRSPFAISNHPSDSTSHPSTGKVAVVLSGGGAKGIAHIGVLKVIERAGIPIDIITGTSMGSIVGGLYSCGWNATALDTIVRKQDWKQLLSDRDDFNSQDLANREKQNTYMLSKTLTIKNKKIFKAGGLIQGKNLIRLFTRLTAGYNDSMDFRKLPIPFACVATNIVDNTEYDFFSGVLPEAMRTSMSIPAAFTPVRKGDMILVDGGLRNNYPADIAREMGADYIIGSTVQGKPKTADDLENGASILGQIVDVNCKNKYEENLAITDIPIRVNTEGYSTASFSPAAVDTLIRRGEEEAMKHWDALMELKRKLGLPKDYKPTLLNPNAAALQPLEPDKDINKKKPDHDRLQGSLGVRYDSEDRVALQLNGKFSSATHPIDLEATMRLGKSSKLSAIATWKPEKLVDMALSYTFRHNNFNLYEEGHNSYGLTYNHHQVSFNLLNINLRNVTMDVSTRWDYYNYTSVLVSSKLEHEPFKMKDDYYFSYHANIHYNSEDNWIFPTRGIKFQAEYAYFTDNFANIDGHLGFSELSALWRMSFKLREKLTFQPLLYGRMLFGRGCPEIRQNVIGGPWFGHYVEQQMPFVGVHHIEFADPHFIATQMKFQQQIYTNNFILLKVAAAQHADKLKNLLKHGPMMGYQLAYYYQTLLGPVGGTVSYSNRTDEVNFFFNLGFEF